MLRHLSVFFVRTRYRSRRNFEEARRLTPFAAELRYDDCRMTRSGLSIGPGPWIAFDKYERGPNPLCANRKKGRV
jgi:hypothetical protein